MAAEKSQTQSVPLVDASRFNTEATASISTTKVLPTGLVVMTKTNEFNPSLVIPRAPLDLSTYQVKEWIEKRDRLGYVELIQFKKNADQTKAIYIHFKRWSSCDHAEDMREQINNGRFIKLYDEDEKRYWKMVRSDLGRPLPIIAPSPYIRWNPRTTDEDYLPEDACDLEGNIPDPEDRKVSLVIPLVLKGYTTEHIKYVFENLLIFEKIERIDPVKLKDTHKFAGTHLTFYIHGTFANTVYANYFQRYIAEKTGNASNGKKTTMQFQVVHETDMAPRNHFHTNWSWSVRKSDIPMPTYKTRPQQKTKTVRPKRVENPNSYKAVLFRPKTSASVSASGCASD